MNTTVVIMYQPFVMEQMVIVYQNGEIVDNRKETVERIPQLMRELSSQYGVSSISLIGNADYLGRFQNEIMSQVPTSVKVNVLN